MTEPIISIPFYTVIFFLLISTGAASAEIYSWTGEDGAINFTDDLGAIPAKKRDAAKSVTVAESPDLPDIKGIWSNKKDGFDTLTIVLSADSKGYVVNAIGLQVPLSWSIDTDHNLELIPAPGKKGQVIKGLYNAENETICIWERDRQSCMQTLLPVEDEDYKAKLRKKKLAAKVSHDRFAFSLETVMDKLSKIVWTREGNLVPGEYGISYGRIPILLAELNGRQYGGRSDWRIPSYNEMRTLLDAVANEPADPEASRDEKLDKALNDIGFIGVKDRPYWTTKIDKDGTPCAVYLFNRGTVCTSMPYNYQFLPVSGPTKLRNGRR